MEIFRKRIKLQRWTETGVNEVRFRYTDDKVSKKMIKVEMPVQYGDKSGHGPKVKAC